MKNGVRYHKVEDSIAQEFQALIIVSGCASMGKCLDEKPGVVEPIVQRFVEPALGLFQCNRSWFAWPPRGQKDLSSDQGSLVEVNNEGDIGNERRLMRVGRCYFKSAVNGRDLNILGRDFADAFDVKTSRN